MAKTFSHEFSASDPALSVNRRIQSKSIPLMYGVIAGALLIVIAALALVFVPPSPPTVSEFAPRAVEQIEQAPGQQSSQFGGGGTGACAVGQVCEDPDAGRSIASKKVIEKARVRRCVGDPPRQTEDPQSPPCVNYFTGDNGGATYKGVTRDEIRVAVPFLKGAKYYDLLVSHFNARYELYGRRLHLVDLPVGSNYRTPPVQQAIALKAKELSAFAAFQLWFGADWGDHSTYRRELARLGIMSFVGLTTEGSTTDFLRDLSPHAWDYYPPLDLVEKNLAEFACRSLVGQSAGYAGAQFQLTTRKFAVLYSTPDSGNQPPVTEPVRGGIDRCGGPVEVVQVPLGDQAQKAMLADFKVRNITTLIYLSHSFAGTTLMNSASSINYQPEWVIVGSGGQINETQWHVVGTPDQRSHMYGLVGWNKFLTNGDMPSYWALREVDPQSDYDSGSTVWDPLPTAYNQLLLLASGIQMAGPRLTPQTFKDGLFRTRFANPGAGGPPFYQASVGFGQGDHVMVDDLAAVWWSDAAPGFHNVSPTGGFCWLDRGARRSLGRWPEGDQSLFDPDPRNCR